MKLIKNIFFIPVAIFANALIYTIVQIFFSFQTLLKEWNLDNIMQNPTLFEDIVGQSIGAAAFFMAGFYIAPEKTKKYRIALIIGFGLTVILNVISILAVNQNYRLLGVLASIAAAYYYLNDDEDSSEFE